MISRQKTSLILVLIYWPSLFILTHIPFGPELLRKFSPSDKALHVLIFFILTFLLYSAFYSSEKSGSQNTFSSLLGALIKLKNRSPWLILLVLIFYAAADEWLQGFMGRNRSLFDFLANLTGIISAFVLLAVFSYDFALLISLGLSIVMMTCAVQMKFAGWLSFARAAFYLFSYALLTFLWIRLFSPKLSVKTDKFKWLLTALSLPVGHFSATLLLSIFLLKKPLKPAEVSFSLAAIAAVVALICAALGFKNRAVLRDF